MIEETTIELLKTYAKEYYEKNSPLTKNKDKIIKLVDQKNRVLSENEETGEITIETENQWADGNTSVICPIIYKDGLIKKLDNEDESKRKTVEVIDKVLDVECVLINKMTQHDKIYVETPVKLNFWERDEGGVSFNIRVSFNTSATPTIEDVENVVYN